MDPDGCRRLYFAPTETLRRWLHGRRSETGVYVLLSRLSDARDAFVTSPDMALGADTTAFPWLPVDTCADTTLYAVTAFRVAMLERIVHDKSAPPHVRMAASLWGDAHFPLMTAAETAGSYTDATLGPLLADHEPRCGTIRHPGAMPDVLDMLAAFGLGTRVSSDSSHVLNRLFCKTLPQRCIVRGLAGIALAESAASPDIREFMIQVCMCSLLAAYPIHDDRPPMRVRRAVYDMMAFHRPENEMVLLEAMSPVMFHVLREFVVACIDMIRPLRAAIGDVYDWPAFSSATSATMTAVRSKIRENFERGVRTGWPRGNRMCVLGRLASIKPHQVPKRGKPPACSPARLMRAALDATEEDLFEALNLNTTRLVTLVTSETIVIARAAKMDDLRDGLRALCGPCGVGLDSKTVDDVVRATDNFAREGAREKTRALVRNIGRACLRDYEILRAFYDTRTASESVLSIPLPSDIRDRQSEVLSEVVDEAFSGTDPTLDVPSTFACCMVCHRFCGFCTDTITRVSGSKRRRDERNERTTRSMGHRRLLADVDVMSGDVRWTCGMAQDKNESKRRNGVPDPVLSHGDVEVDMIKDRRKRARALRTEATKKRCRSTPVQFFEMLGVALRVTSVSGSGSIVVLCTVCAQPFSYTPPAFDTGTAVCCQCTHRAIIRRRIHCVACAAHVPEDSDVARQWLRKVVWDDLPPADRPRTFENAQDPAQCARTVYFCRRHWHRWVEGSTELLPLSIVLVAVRRHPITGHFAYGTVRVGGKLFPVVRDWTRNDPSIPGVVDLPRGAL